MFRNTRISHSPQFFTEGHQGLKGLEGGFIRCFVPPLFLETRNDHWSGWLPEEREWGRQERGKGDKWRKMRLGVVNAQYNVQMIITELYA